GDARRLDLLVDVLAGQHLAGGVVHHQPCGGLRRARRGRYGNGGRGGAGGRLRGRRRGLGEGQAEGERGRRGKDGERAGGTELHEKGDSCGIGLRAGRKDGDGGNCTAAL